MHYLLEDGESPSGKPTCTTALQSQQHLGVSKPVTKILAAPTDNCIIVNVADKMLVLEMRTLQPVDDFKPLKGVARIAHGHGAALSRRCEVSALRKKVISHFAFYGGSLGPHKEYRDFECDQREVDDMCRDGRTICLARRNTYSVVDIVTQEVTEIYQGEADTESLVKRVGMKEFLLSVGTGGVTTGMFVSSRGTYTSTTARNG